MFSQRHSLFTLVEACSFINCLLKSIVSFFGICIFPWNQWGYCKLISVCNATCGDVHSETYWHLQIFQWKIHLANISVYKCGSNLMESSMSCWKVTSNHYFFTKIIPAFNLLKSFLTTNEYSNKERITNYYTLIFLRCASLSRKAISQTCYSSTKLGTVVHNFTF